MIYSHICISVCTYILVYFYVSLFLLCSSISWKHFNLFKLTCYRSFWYYLGNHLFKKNLTASRSLLGFILELTLKVFLYLLRAVQPFLIKVFTDAFYVIPMLTALKKFFTVCFSLLEAILGYYLLGYVIFFLFFLCFIFFFISFFSTCFPRKFCIYLLDNTLIVVRLKTFMGYCPLLRAV